MQLQNAALEQNQLHALISQIYIWNSTLHSMKRENQQDATIICLLLTSVSTCFGHHYAHLQENKGPVTAFCVYWSGFVGCGW